MNISSEVLKQEFVNHNTTTTKNEEIEKDGYVVVKNLWNPEELYYPLPKERGRLLFFGSIEKFTYDAEDYQGIPGSLLRNNHPQYKKIYNAIRLKVEKIIGRKLNSTYYYDRFYFPGQMFPDHLGEDPCEITVKIIASTNLTESWPAYIKTPDIYQEENHGGNPIIMIPGTQTPLNLDPGDAVIYKGCERPFWREPMPSPKRKWFSKKGIDGIYYHEISFQYVLSDGQRAHITAS